MSLGKYLNKNKIGGLILIIVIIVAFGFGGFGGGFLSNNQNNIAKINKTNVTTQNLLDYINQSGISQKTIQENLNDNIIEELLSGLISTTLIGLEIDDFYLKISQNSLSKKIKFNSNFLDENDKFERLKDRELQKKLFDYIGAGTVPPKFLIKKIYETENRKLNIDYINLDSFYKKSSEITEDELKRFIDTNNDQLKVEYIDFKYAIINPQNLIGINEFNQDFFEKIDQIENNILNGIDFDAIISEFGLSSNTIEKYKYSESSSEIEKKIYQVRNNNFDVFENNENYIIYKIENLEQLKPDLKDAQIKKEVLELVIQKKKFDYNRDLLEKIQNKEFFEDDFLRLGKNKIQSLKLNSIRDNKKFEINSVQMLYSLPLNSFTLINDEDENIYLAQIKNYDDIKSQLDTKDFDQLSNKENTKIRNDILKSYDIFLNKKYNVDINQIAIDNVKNLFQ